MSCFKRAVSFFLAICTAAGLAACTSSVSTGGTDVCIAFLDLICAGAYEEAFELVAPSVRIDVTEDEAAAMTVPESTAKPADKGLITKKDFAAKYSNIIEGLSIESIDYVETSMTDGQSLSSVSYGACYHSSRFGDIESSFRMIAVKESGTWYVEWSPDLIFPELGWNGSVRVATIAAKRGEIFADGELLAATVGNTSVYCMPSRLEDRNLAVKSLSAILAMTEADVNKAIDSAYNDFALIKVVDPELLTAAVRAQLTAIKGVGIDEGSYGVHREYPYGETLSHIVGYIGYIDADGLDEELIRLNEGRTEEDGLYTSDSLVGKLGLEKQYETQLRGKDGIMAYIVSGDGVNLRTLYRRDAQNGSDINLTVDIKLQLRLEEVLKLVLFGDTTAGAVVVLNPKTGDITAAASYPFYDLNTYAEDYTRLSQMENKPLINRITQGLYPPGSVFKAFTACCTLESGLISPDWVFTETIEEDYWTPKTFGAWVWPQIKRASMNNRTGPLNMHNAIITSDNIYFAYAAMTLGQDKLFSYSEKLGFGEAIRFDMPVATSQMLNEGTEMTMKLLADSGYGQGEILITPLQLACAFSAIRNGGDIMVPHIVESMYEDIGIDYSMIYEEQTEIWKANVISDAAITTITPMLEHVVSSDYNGTGHSLKVKRCVVAAKTGTAEIGSDKSREISWFVGFRTGVSPEDERLVLVMLEVPATSEFSSLKFEIARNMLEMPAE